MHTVKVRRYSSLYLFLVLLLVGLFFSSGSATAQDPAARGPILTIDNRSVEHVISPNIYGINLADPQAAQLWQLPANRWGGNAVTRYNWQLDVYNPGNYWYFANTNNPDPGTLPAGSAADRFVANNINTGSQSLMQLSTIGWVPKDRSEDCAYHWDKYGWQTEANWNYRYGCGNGIAGDTELPIANDPTDTSIAIDETYSAEWVTHLVSQFGTTRNGGVNYFALDNEPMIWHLNHRDIHPEPATFNEVFDMGVRYGSAVKNADPTAKIMGPGSWGWTSYTYSYLDLVEEDVHPQLEEHGLPFVPWYLQQMRQYEESEGTRLLDYLDVHYYPQGQASDGDLFALTDADTAATQSLRLRSTQELWDMDHSAESWIEQPTYVVPRLRSWIDQYYPGTGLAITEYAWGGLEHINGALTQADVFGIFGQERVDMAYLWDAPEIGQPGDFAIRMYRNYDGQGGTFGDLAHDTASTNTEQLSIFAAGRSATNEMTVMVVNKTANALTSDISFLGMAPLTGIAQVYRYSSADLNNIVASGITIDGPVITDEFPAESITLYVLPMADTPTVLNATADTADPISPIWQWVQMSRALKGGIPTLR